MEKLTDSQAKAMDLLHGRDNIFLTGAAGTGKSYVIQKYMDESIRECALLATTGMAAIILSGRTFHSFFSLWDFNSPFEIMIESAMKNGKMRKRLEIAEEIIIDEISMIDEGTMRAGEEIARKVRKSPEPWGGLRVIAVGDFCQLPPVDTKRKKGDPVKWIFDTPVWQHSDMNVAELTEIMRTGDTKFMDVLNKVRQGIVDDEVTKFVNQHTKEEYEVQDIEGTRIFGRRSEVDAYNEQKMLEIDEPLEKYEAEVDVFSSYGEDKIRNKILRNMPVDEVLELKKGALVMIRKNYLEKGYANGSLGHYVEKDGNRLYVELLDGEEIDIEPMEFMMKDGDGKVQAIAKQYPLSLAWASTIHKSQGATLDVVIADMNQLWDSGQAYVAMSRTKTSEGFHVLNYSPNSIIIDDRVKQFYSFAS